MRTRALDAGTARTDGQKARSMHVAALVLLGAAAALAQRPGHTPCVHGTPGDTAWTDDTALRSATLAQLPNRTTPSRHVLNLDLPAEQRWDEICKIYKPRTYIIHDYLKNSLGKLGGAMGIIEAVAARLAHANNLTAPPLVCRNS